MKTLQARRLATTAGLLAVLAAGPLPATHAQSPSTPAVSSEAEPTTDVDDQSAGTGSGTDGAAPDVGDLSGDEDTAPLSAEVMAANERALAEEIGRDGASLGQGIVRLATSGDPQIESPTEGKAQAGSVGAAATNYWKPSGVLGVDVSSHQGAVDWTAARNQGSLFAYVKATEATNYVNPYFSAQYGGSESVGMLRGAYHFAVPSVSSGAQQATYFMNQGGGWTADGKTLPPLLDVEYNPYSSLGNACYNMSAAQMVTWIRDFSNTVYKRIGRLPMIYTTTDWWNTCTGSSSAFANHPLHIANYNNVGAGRMPAGWTGYDLWQYTSIGPVVGDWNQWPSSLTALQAFARNGNAPLPSPGAAAISALASRTPTLGSATSGLGCGLVGGGCYQSYQRGSIHWSPATGAHATKGAIRAAWAATGYERGRLGYPTGGEICGLVNGGCYQSFQLGTMIWSPDTGAHATKGAIRKSWGTTDYERGRLGYPTGSEVCGLVKGGCYQSFQGGTITWSLATGAHPTNGAIRRAWGTTGYERGRLGYPTRGEVCTKTTSCTQTYQRGTITWTPAAGARIRYTS